MRSSALLLLLALAASLAACGRALDLLDPSGVIQALSEGGAGLEKWRKPDFCNKLECPPYKRREKADNYEVRRYEGGKWIVTTVNDTKYELAYMKGSARLLKYFKGENSEKKKFDVTTPTLAELKLDEKGEGSERSYNFSLWLPEDLQKDTPQPTEGEVQVIKYPSIEVYVRIFHGFATEGSILEEANSLKGILDEEGRDFDDELVWAATYDPPQKLLNRHNEIHIPAGKKKAVPIS